MTAMLHASWQRVAISDTGSLRDDIQAYLRAVSATSVVDIFIRGIAD